MNLEGIVAVASGGASGLGAATAKALAECGARVAIWDLHQEHGTTQAEQLDGLYVKVNVADEDSVRQALEITQKRLGTPRVMVNTAGIATSGKIVGRDGPHSLDVFMQAINVNLVGTFNCSRFTADAMQRLEPLEDGERGVIINTASIAAFEGQVGQVAYAASKGGVASMTLVMARELASKGIRCNAIAPGVFATPMVTQLPENVVTELSAAVPFPNRLGHPEEYASLVREICENSFINGTTIRLDGAIRLQARQWKHKSG